MSFMMRRGINSSAVLGGTTQTFSANSATFNSAAQYFRGGNILDLGASSFSFTGTFLVDSTATDQACILSRYTGGSNPPKCYMLRYRTSGQVLQWYVQGGGTGGSLTIPISLDTLYSFYVSYDAIAEETSIRLDGGTPVTLSHTAGVNSGGTANFEIGSVDGNNFFKGSSAMITAYDRILTDAEQTEVYNGGVPICYDARSAALNTATVSDWDLAKWSGRDQPLVDNAGSSDLTAFNSPTYTDVGLDVECT